MEVGTQQAAARVALPSSKMGDACTPPYTCDIRSFCQLQVANLVAIAPSLKAAWIVYQDPESGFRQSVAHYKQDQCSSSADLSYLDSQQWWRDSLSSLQISKLTIEGNLNAYVCPLRCLDGDPEYVLICTDDPLCAGQQQWVEQQTQLLAQYLDMCRNSARQQAEIQLLEQVVRRTEHQLRNPLALINLYAETLCLGLPAGNWQEQAKLIRETASDLSSHLTDLIYCGQQVKMRVAPYDLRAILGESIKGVQPWIEEKQLKIGYPDTPLILAVDRWQMKQVFDNLLSNAVHFSDRGGKITCHWQMFRDEVLVEVRDRGPGLSEEDLKQAFTPFYSRRPGGTGLGLAIAKKIILDHRGSLWVENLPEGGAQFSFSLPRSPVNC